MKESKIAIESCVDEAIIIEGNFLTIMNTTRKIQLYHHSHRVNIYLP